MLDLNKNVQVDVKHQYEHLKVSFIIRIGMVPNTWLSGQTEGFLLC
jgi:hypothetical protein